MADIFISYAHEDRARIEPLARALQADGYDVWWDREKESGLKPGDDFDMVIEEQLETAVCVIVGWSGNSRTSRYVRDEARDALERGVLVPVFLEQVKPPLGFRSLHTEDFGNWQGDLTAENWQRLTLQTKALKEAAQPKAVNVDTSTSPLEPALAGPASAAPAPTGKGPFNASATIALTTVPLMAAAWFFSSGPQLGVMGLTVILALLAFLLFRQADLDMHPHMKALASRWLLPQQGRAKVNMSEAFLRLFEAVFGPRHFSWRCIWRSMVASTLGLIVMLLVFDYFQTGASLLDFEGGVTDLAVSMIALGIPVNVLGDYLSLWETRTLLHVAARRPVLLPLLIPLDALLTLLIWIVSLSLPFFLFVINEGQDVKELVELLYRGLEIASQGLLDISTYELKTLSDVDDAIVLGAMLATSYITSLWLWLAVLGAPLARLLVWSRTSGLSSLGRFIDTENRPFTALGLLIALLILLTGSMIWGFGFLWG